MTIHISNKHASPRWPGKLERKIDIYVDGKYSDSSRAYTSCKNAVLGYKLVVNPSGKVTARFS